jgi:K+-sensing histidine kinase KdpD
VVLLAALIGGCGPGFAAVALAALAFNYYYISPAHSFLMKPSSVMRYGIFCKTASFIAAVGGAQKINLKNLSQARG